MNKMCNKERTISLIKLAKKEEKYDPQSAAKNYLLAAEALLKEGVDHPEKEEKCQEYAHKIYLKAKKLRKQKIQPGKIISPAQNQVTFESVGGLEELKEEIRFKIIEPLKNPELFEYYGKGMGGGILMYGPPGCGKSLIAKATANEAKANFIHVKSSDLKSKYVGETEKNIAELFEKARKSQPTIIFFDEFEALGSDRSNSHSHERSAVAQLLTEMDGVDTKEQQILLLAATNEPWAIDPALRREGRFGSTIFVPLPDLEARETIIRTNMIYRPTEEINYLEIAHSTKRLSGADVKGICEMATDIPLKESILTGQRRKISKADFSSAVKKNNSVIKQWFAKAVEQLKQKKMEEFFGDLLIHAQKIEGISC